MSLQDKEFELVGANKHYTDKRGNVTVVRPDGTKKRIRNAQAWYKRIGFEDWFWIIFIILAVGFVFYQKHSSDVKKATAAAQSCPDPEIKGNISYTTGEKIYHVPGDRFYDKTIIDTSSGERMFCTTKEAEQAGWRASGL